MGNTEAKHQPTTEENNDGVTSGTELHRVLYDYDARKDDELSINKDELLEILDKSNEHWWLARFIKTQEEGLVPSNYVAVLESNEIDMPEDHNSNHYADPTNSIDDKDWYFGNMEGVDLDKLLHGPNNPQGTFLIRDSRRFPGQFTLSVRDHRDHVRKYSIQMQENIGYYISKSKTFRTITELVNFYKLQADGICCKLEMPLPKITPRTSSLSNDTWEIKIDSLKMESRIGRGRYSDVWKGIVLGESRSAVAIKIVKKGTKTQSAFQKEADIMKNCMHENLVRLYGICSDNPTCMVLEYMANGSLRDYLRGNYGRSLGISDLIKIAAQISNGMAYLETIDIVHRDLRACNVLVDEHMKFKVSDFGWACMLGDNKRPSKSEDLPIRWTALEILRFVGKFTIKSDVWSFGVLLSELITYGQLPYPDMLSNQRVCEQVINGYRMPQLKDCPVEIYDLMHKCWRSEPEDRPPFNFIHDFLHNYYDQWRNDGTGGPVAF